MGFCAGQKCGALMLSSIVRIKMLGFLLRAFFLSGFCKRVSSDPFKICNGDNNKEPSLKTTAEFLLCDSGSLTFR